MKRLIKCIYLVWRAGRGRSRVIVGIIRKNQMEGATFRYIQKGVEEAVKSGFIAYPDFPDIDKTYKNVIDVFSQRLNNSERADIQSYYDYWKIDPKYKNDKYYILAQTQGLLPTDNFEFIAEYYPVRDIKFISEICGLSINKLPTGFLTVGEEIEWRLEKGNKYDSNAVVLLKNEQPIGYIKQIHNRVFHYKYSKHLRVFVKSIDQNGHINRAFVEVSQGS